MTTKLALGVALASVLVLTACGGGGGGGDTLPQDTTAPTVVSVQAISGTQVLDLMTPGTQEVPVNSVITVKVNEKLGCPAVQPTVGTFGSIAGAVTCFDTLLTLVPSALFANGTHYDLTVHYSDLAGNAGEPLQTWFVTVPPAGATVTLSATPDTIVAGASTTLAWVTTNAVNCIGSGGLSGSLSPAGGTVTVTPTVTTEYGMECYNSANVTTGVVTTTVTVNPKPVKLEYSNVVVAIRPAILLNLYGVDRTVPGAYVPIKNLTGKQFYSMGIRMPRADNCLVEVSALDNRTGVEYKMLFNPKTLEMTMDNTGNQATLVRFRNDDFKQGDYLFFNYSDPAVYPLWYTMAQVPDGQYYTLNSDASINLWFVDNDGVVSQLTNTTYEATGVIFGLWSFTCKAQ